MPATPRRENRTLPTQGKEWAEPPPLTVSIRSKSCGLFSSIASCERVMTTTDDREPLAGYAGEAEFYDYSWDGLTEDIG